MAHSHFLNCIFVIYIWNHFPMNSASCAQACIYCIVLYYSHIQAAILWWPGPFTDKTSHHQMAKRRQISKEIVVQLLPKSSTSRIITPPIWRSPLTLRLLSTCKSVTNTVRVQDPSLMGMPPLPRSPLILMLMMIRPTLLSLLLRQVARLGLKNRTALRPGCCPTLTTPTPPRVRTSKQFLEVEIHHVCI